MPAGAGTGAARQDCAAAPLRDSYGRAISDLRISITDRCNYRCVYCRSGNSAYDGQEPMTWEEIERLAAVFVQLGINKIRLTGGEPLLRAGLLRGIEQLSTLSVSDLTLTTNGHLLRQRAADLKRAGLQRITVSLDTLRADRFDRITRTQAAFERVLDGIRAAQEAGLNPVKVNAVLVRGWNDDEVEAFARFARDWRVSMRFIEFMPLGEDRAWSMDKVVGFREIVERIGRVYPLVAVEGPAHETARRFRFADHEGAEIGVIAPVTQPFCGQCSRIRLTADGKIRTCLFSHREWDLLALLRSGGSDAELRAFITGAVEKKEDRHHIGESNFQAPSRTMVQIGG